MASKLILKRIQFSLLPRHIKQLSTVSTEPQFLGIQSKFTNELKFTNDQSYEPIPIYRILQPPGQTKDENHLLDNETLRKMYFNMVTIGIMDKILYESQRQGRISFYMTNSGEEAVQTGSAAALTLRDVVYAQYREAGVLLYRGFKISEFINQCYGNYLDKGKGKQMPVHYGSKELNFVTISSPLTTQLPQAVGAAYALKRSKGEACVICYFGDGAASEGDAHAALNFAATLDCPIIFFCRNNGYAISTPTSEQYKGDGIAAKGPAYGINTLRVDGNDVLAVHRATQYAREFCINESKPVLIEAMTYRIGHHSTSDDSTAYRSVDEIAKWNEFAPTIKFRHYLENLGIWNEAEEANLIKSKREETLSVFTEAEKKPKPSWKELFTDVYHEMPSHIKEQMESLESHLKEYGQHYPLGSFKEMK
ncbi:2-oxoisovalerate dehydrogenase subunit alpha, mitochondrial [Leptopilina heterotoma]|uniref:2-oxoisovalerate dehydrogenase subunit alpha, mitochondrial n=1 Tax=Leptopilina heterotoma TaxID=63436 RepID=UPI001CA836DB|nr:2-oxoisovalerate dehydrogenase subunit alpha, mitochondrial [Leptopilina heterotoma]